jgi:hypothetical protein
VNTLNPELDANLPLRTHGALPSSRTESQTEEALASDDIELVKAQLAHVWGHYQSLEFIVNAVKQNFEGVAGLVDTGFIRADDTKLGAEVALRVLAGKGIEGAYKLAHFSMDLVAVGASPAEAIRAVYDGAGFDFSDPQREDQIDKLIADLLADDDADD